MTQSALTLPTVRVVVELLKPITWFAPMWAFCCGVASYAGTADGRWPIITAGVLLAGPLICGTSQAANDWFDRHVDAINEPDRPIPSGRVPGRWGLYIAIAWTILSIVTATVLGPWGFGAALVGLVLAWLYSAPPFRLKLNGWWGNAAVAVCYEGLPWVTGAVVMGAPMPAWHILALAGLYSAGAHGIMTLNDFKSVEGDIRTGVGSLPVRLGVPFAARLACVVMALPQLAVIACLVAWSRPYHAIAVTVLLIAQIVLMRRFLGAPRERAPWYNATGTSLYVIGMLVSAFAMRGGPL